MNNELSSHEIRSIFNDLFAFLNRNRTYNQQLQLSYFQMVIHENDTVFEKLCSLLYSTAGSQSQPKIDYLGIFFKTFYERFSTETTSITFNKLARHFGDTTATPNFYSFYLALKSKQGWGPKTSALFVKNLYNIEHGYAKQFAFLPGTPKLEETNDKLFLPVDAVIREIFKPIFHIKSNHFNRINTLLQSVYSPSEMEIWDDLWFWGFFSSNMKPKEKSGSSGIREFKVFNENKYWALQEADKTPATMKEVQSLIKEFCGILKSFNTSSAIKRAG